MLQEQIEKEFDAIMKERFRPILHVLPKIEALKEKVLAALPKSEEEDDKEEFRIKREEIIAKRSKKHGKEEESK